MTSSCRRQRSAEVRGEGRGPRSRESVAGVPPRQRPGRHGSTTRAGARLDRLSGWRRAASTVGVGALALASGCGAEVAAIQARVAGGVGGAWVSHTTAVPGGNVRSRGVCLTLGAVDLAVATDVWLRAAIDELALGSRRANALRTVGAAGLTGLVGPIAELAGAARVAREAAAGLIAARVRQDLHRLPRAAGADDGVAGRAGIGAVLRATRRAFGGAGLADGSSEIGGATAAAYPARAR